MIQTNDLCKIFKRTIGDENGKKQKKKKKTSEDFYAVNNVSITANSGEILGILGPNGAGKTTLLRMMGCLMDPTSGNVSIYKEGDELVTDSVEMKRMIGYLSANTKLYHRFTIREMLGIIAEIYGVSKEEIPARIDEVCNILNLESFIDNKIERLSTGQTQRANIARCLVHRPEIYIFDEPTLGLDIISSESIIEFMKEEKKKGKTILYSTHYMEEAQYLCDKIVLMHNGRIIGSGTPKSLMEETNTDNLRETFRTFIKAEEESHE